MFGGTYAMMGGSKAKPSQAPPINATSKDEENFIQYVIPPDILRDGKGRRIVAWGFG